MTSWLQKWWADNGHNCTGIPFAKCFQFHQGVGGQDCGNNTIGGCTPPNPLSYKDQHVFYALWNIYVSNQSSLDTFVSFKAADLFFNKSINAYFSNYWLGLSAAEAKVDGKILAIIEQLNVPKTMNVALDGLLIALSTVLSFVKVPDIATGISRGSKDSLTALFNSFQQAPVVSRFVFPETGTLGSQVAQLGDVSSETTDMISAYQSNITSSLQHINGDFSNFLTFANSTAFSNPVTNIQVLSDNALQAVYTYVISQVMQANNIAVVSGPIGDTSQVQKGVDGDKYYDPSNNIAYSMNKLDKIHGNWTNAMNSFFNANLTTPELLFKGAADCNNADKFPSGLVPSAASPNGGGMKCLSSAQYCTYEPSKIDPSKEFTNCKTQDSFGSNDCKGSDGTSESVLVPVGYLGAYDNGQRDLCAG